MCNQQISKILYRCFDHNTCSKYCSDKLMSINIKRDSTLTNHNIWIKDIANYIQPQVIDIYPDIYYFDNTRNNISNNISNTSNNTCYYITHIIPNNYYITSLYTNVIKLVSSISSEIDNLYKKKKKKLY